MRRSFQTVAARGLPKQWSEPLCRLCWARDSGPPCWNRTFWEAAASGSLPRWMTADHRPRYQLQMEDLFTFTSAAWLRGSAGGEPPVVTDVSVSNCLAENKFNKGIWWGSWGLS